MEPKPNQVYDARHAHSNINQEILKLPRDESPDRKRCITGYRNEVLGTSVHAPGDENANSVEGHLW